MFRNFSVKATEIFHTFLKRNRYIFSAMEPVELVDSHDVLNSIIINSGLTKDEAVSEYLKQVQYQSIGDFKSGLEWINVSEPLSFSKHLKGKIVILDFFTYCCINCMHILPDLKEIENEFSIEDGLVVVGVHSAKFENEKNSKNILSAVQRYNISHPVVNDHTNDMWQKCDICCWPTLLVLGPKANPLLMLMGEGHKETLRLLIRNALNHYKNDISSHPLPIKSAFHHLPELKGPLLFPGKITNYIDDDINELIAISDTGNHRILVLKSDGSVIEQIGNSTPGFKDGNFKSAQFNSPQGLTFKSKDVLFVADTENHAIRKIDLKTKRVETICGNGKQGDDKVGGNIGASQQISSPWDICLFRTSDMNNESGRLKDVLIIAMAGTHQIWALFLDDTVWWKSKMYKGGTCAAIAGSGREENRNNQYPNNAAFAQPSGLALCKKNKEIYIADSESSTVRKLSLSNGKVSAVVGGDINPSNLFAFGDVDGTQHNAKLQHVLGLAISQDENSLYVADTYNHKLKKINVSKNEISTIKSNTTDTIDGALPSFNEPAGLCITNEGAVLVADTNNHCIKILKLNNGNIEDIKVLELKFDAMGSKSNKVGYQVLPVEKLICSTSGGKLILQIKLSLTNGLKINEEAPQKWFVDLPSGAWSSVPVGGTSTKGIDLVISVPNGVEEKVIDIIFNLITCTKDSCYPKNFIVRQAIEFANGGSLENKKVVDVNLEPNKVNLKL